MKRNFIFICSVVIAIILAFACTGKKNQNLFTSNHDQAIAHYNHGVELHDYDTDGALSEYQQALALDPDIGEVYLNIGLIYINRGEYDKGEDFTKTALSTFERTNTKVAESQSIQELKAICNNNIGVIYIRKMEGSSDEYMAKSYHSTALDYFKKAQEIDPTYKRAQDNYNAYKNFDFTPKDGATLYDEGVDALDVNNYDLAITKFNSAINLDPSIGEAYLNIGLCYLRKGDYDQCERNSKEAINTFRKYKKVIASGQTLQELIAICYLNMGLSYIGKARDAADAGDTGKADIYHKTALEHFKKGMEEAPSYQKIKDAHETYKTSYK
ncbi:MAG TPA: tetratricopeptide repeat protein [Firmicutes bacterium]|nr:tetratricopeptide repeat protein [Bacillota bacterium]